MRDEYRQTDDDRDDGGGKDRSGCNVLGVPDVLIRLDGDGVGKAFDRRVECLGEPNDGDRKDYPAPLLSRQSKVDRCDYDQDRRSRVYPAVMFGNCEVS